MCGQALEQFCCGWRWSVHDPSFFVCVPSSIFDERASKATTIGYPDLIVFVFLCCWFMRGRSVRWTITNLYSLLGMLGTDFHSHLYQFQQQFGATSTSKRRRNNNKGRLARALDDVFHLQNSSDWKALSDNKNKKKKTKISQPVTNTPKRLLQYYSPRTVRRVLEYMSIDYVLLGMPIPQWAEEILQQEQESQQ